VIAGLDGGVCGLQDGAHIWTGPAATRLTSGFIVDYDASRSGLAQYYTKALARSRSSGASLCRFMPSWLPANAN